MLYNDYLKKLSQQFDVFFSQISTNQNTEYGNEFEISLCKTLRKVIPQRFGVCRGYVVPRQGKPQGDDVIIYERSHFPTLRMLDEDFSQKEEVPVEAVRAYIEAKHTIAINGTDKNTIVYAQNQLSQVVNLSRDTIYGAIWARNVIAKPGNYKKLTDEEIRDLLRAPSGETIKPEFDYEIENPKLEPDLAVFGPNNIQLPFEVAQDTGKFGRITTINDPPKSRIAQATVPGLAFAMGICAILNALERPHNLHVPWDDLLYDGYKETAPQGGGGSLRYKPDPSS